MNDTAQRDWLARFPELARIDDPEFKRLAAMAQVVNLPAGVTVFRPGDACQSYLLVLDGSVRVQKVSESGREIVLYRIGPGESCILTTSCLMAGERYPADGITESAVTAVSLPVAAFQRAVVASDAFRRFVFASFGERMTDLMVLVEAVAFGRMDSRLAARLVKLGGASGKIAITHQQLAAELGTAREVVSRLLKEFERNGWLSLERGQIALRDVGALSRLVAGVASV
jgi:CRP/FNR family transcriptional regulator, anaerobic regulatory protein